MRGWLVAIVLGACLTACTEPPCGHEGAHVCGRVSHADHEPARSLRVTLREGNTVLGAYALSASDDGRFVIPFDAPASSLAITVEAIVLDAGRASIAVGELEDPDATVSHRLWSWRFDVCASDCDSAIDAGELTIDEAEGAARALDTVAAALERTASHPAMDGIEPPSVLVLWSEVEPRCGSCYRPLELGGGELVTSELERSFDAVIHLSPDASDATIAHEASHWIMEGFSRWPGDLAVHDPSQLARPGVAYTEGWATFNGQSVRSWMHGTPMPLADFGALEVDLEAGTVNGAPVPAPLGSSTDDPWATEATVAAILWAIRDAAGDAPMIAVLQSARLRTMERDHGRTDLLDMLDALVCDGLVSEAIVAAAADAYAYPWRPEERVCPP